MKKEKRRFRKGLVVRLSAASLLIGICGLSATGTAVAADTYTCQALDVPGASSTQVWRLNNQGYIAATSSLGPFVYNPNTGKWTPLPAPPATSGYAITDLSVFDINDQDTIVGGAKNAKVAGGIEKGFILSSLSGEPTYTFYDYVDPANSDNANTEFRGVGDNGLIVGWAFSASNTSGGFVFNPTSSSIGTFAPGFTTVDPTLSDGSTSIITQLAGVNASGLIAGSSGSSTIAREGILLGPDSLALLPIPSDGLFSVSIRSVNDLDVYESGNCDSKSSCVRAAGFANSGTSSFYFDYDPVTKYVQPLQTVDCSKQIPASAGQLAIQGINDAGTVTGSYYDASNNAHGIIGYANVNMPVSTSSDGTKNFDFGVSKRPIGTNKVGIPPYWIDPPIAGGYGYAIGEGNPSFASVLLPILAAGSNQYTLLTHGQTFTVPAGKQFDFTVEGFPQGVESFTVFGIDPANGIGVSNTTSFVTGVTFTGTGQFTGTMKPYAAQTITFPPIPTQTIGIPLSLSASASSGLPVSFSSSSPGVCTISGTQASFLAAGSCVITATQAGNSTYAPASPVVRSFTVTAATVVNIVPKGVTFAPTIVGTISEDQLVTLTNSGSKPLSITSIGLNGAQANSFIDINECGTSLAAGKSCAIYVGFAPQKPGSATATLSFADNAAESPQTVTLTGTGAAAQALSVAPTALLFPATPVGGSSEGQSVTLTNSGTSVVAITKISVNGADPKDFVQLNNCSADLAAGASCTVFVAFTPTAKGARTATLSVTDDAAASPQVVTLSGTGN